LSVLTRSSRPKTDLTRSHIVLSASSLSLILIKSNQIVPNTFLYSPKRLQYVLSTLYQCSVRVVAFVSSPFNDNSVCCTIKSGGYNYGLSSQDIWLSALESFDGGFCGGASFSVEGLATTVCSSACVGRGAAFLRLLLFFLGGMLWYLLLG